MQDDEIIQALVKVAALEKRLNALEERLAVEVAKLVRLNEVARFGFSIDSIPEGATFDEFAHSELLEYIANK